MLEQSVDRVKSWGESSCSCPALSCCTLSCGFCWPSYIQALSKMSGHGKLSRQCIVSTERPSSVRPPMDDQCLSVSFCSMVSYQPPREALHACSKRTRWLSGAGRQPPHCFFLNLKVELEENCCAAQQILFFFLVSLVKSQQEILASSLILKKQQNNQHFSGTGMNL